MRIVEQTANRLVIENKPRIIFLLVITLGLVATLASFYSLVISGEPADEDNLIGLVVGLVCVFGTAFLYRETTTILDRQTGKVSWRQRALTGKKDR